MSKHLFVLIFVISTLSLGLVACDDCTDCGVVKNEPRLLVRFYEDSTRKVLPITIDTINNVYSGEIETVKDTLVSFYRLPLDMFSDTTMLTIRSIKSSDSLAEYPQYDTLLISYELNLEKSPLNRYRYRASRIRLIEHTYDSASLICTFSNCDMDDTELRLYY